MAHHRWDAKHMQELLWQKWEEGVFSTRGEVKGSMEAAASGAPLLWHSLTAQPDPPLDLACPGAVAPTSPPLLGTSFPSAAG